MNSQDAMAGAAGLRGTILDMLYWGVVHLRGSTEGGGVLQEGVETVTQVKSHQGRSIEKKVFFLFLKCFAMYVY